MQRNYIFKTKDGTHEVSVRGTKGLKKLNDLKEKNPDIKIQHGALVVVIITDFEDLETLKKEVLN